MGLDQSILRFDPSLDGADEDGETFAGNPVEFGYWRRFHALHNWVERSVLQSQDDINGKSIDIDIEQLRSLRSLLGRVVDKPRLARQLFPTFFGYIDEDYWEHVNKTIEILDGLIKDDEERAKSGGPAFEYLYWCSY